MTSRFNLKPREVWCPQCKKYKVSDEAAPTCDDCFGKPMLTVVYSLITGERLTGVEPNELGPTSSRPSQ